MTHGHSLWFWLAWACVIWYSTVTVYVGVRGFADIKHMLRRLEGKDEARGEEKKNRPPP
jgi:hypothetical protein